MSEIAPDPSGWLTALRFDIDTDGGGAAWIEAELPAPNLVVINPRNGHANLIYLLGGWVRTDFGDPSRLKVVRYAAAIERAYAAALGAETAYSGRFHPQPAFRRLRDQGRPGRPVLARRTRAVRRPRHAGDQTAADRTRPQRGGLRPVEALGVHRDRGLAHWQGPRLARGGGASRRPDRGRRRRRKPARPAQAERGSVTSSRAWRAGSGSVTSSGCRRCCARPGSRRSASGRSPPEGPGSRPGAFAQTLDEKYTLPRHASVAQRPRKCVARACRYARLRQRYDVRLLRSSGCSERLYRVRPAYRL